MAIIEDHQRRGISTLNGLDEFEISRLAQPRSRTRIYAVIPTPGSLARYRTRFLALWDRHGEAGATDDEIRSTSARPCWRAKRLVS